MGHLVGNLGLPWLFHSLLMEIFQRFHILQRIADSAAKCPTLRLQYIIFLFFTPIHCTRLPLGSMLLWSLNLSLLHHLSECAHHLNQRLREDILEFRLNHDSWKCPPAKMTNPLRSVVCLRYYSKLPFLVYDADHC